MGKGSLSVWLGLFRYATHTCMHAAARGTEVTLTESKHSRHFFGLRLTFGCSEISDI